MKVSLYGWVVDKVDPYAFNLVQRSRSVNATKKHSTRETPQRVWAKAQTKAEYMRNRSTKRRASEELYDDPYNEQLIKKPTPNAPKVKDFSLDVQHGAVLGAYKNGEYYVPYSIMGHLSKKHWGACVGRYTAQGVRKKMRDGSLIFVPLDTHLINLQRSHPEYW